MSGALFRTGLLLTALHCYPVLLPAQEQPNVIVILLDDLNDYASLYEGHPQSPTPAIAAIEDRGITFLNAHASAPKCNPSRTSFLTGKDCAYTQVYNNMACHPFRSYFNEADGNGVVYTLPEIMKDSGGYFTFGINKINHCFDTWPDLDTTAAAPCNREWSWNRYSLFVEGESEVVKDWGNDHQLGFGGLAWSIIPDSLESYMYDYQAVDTLQQFLHEALTDPSTVCNKPLFVMIGLRRPHSPWYIPEKYYAPYYLDDYYENPLIPSYNHPQDQFPYNGVVMPPQPETLFGDYYSLPDTSLARYVIDQENNYADFTNRIYQLDPLPPVGAGLSEDERFQILVNSYMANAVIAYLAATSFVDAQIGRIMTYLEEEQPAFLSNTIIVIASDHGFSLGEKSHWKKSTLWETDLRAPFIVADYREERNGVSGINASLLDLFPTLCGMTGVPEPKFPDGSRYLDGMDLGPFMAEPNLYAERPALAAYEEHSNLECSCFPMYSVRNDRFHLHRFASNGPVFLDTDCNEEENYYEYLLYDIGVDRQTDPNEWNDLAADPDFRPVMDYLLQWLPGHPLYLQKTWKPRIQFETDCLVADTTILVADMVLTDTNGLETLLPDTLTARWFTNMSADTLTGAEVIFPAAWNIDALLTGEPLLLFLELTDTNDIVRGLDMQYVFTTGHGLPDVELSVYPSGLQVFLEDIHYSGSPSDAYWVMGNGDTLFSMFPSSYTYSSDGDYTAEVHLLYGNDSSCEVVKTFDWSLTDIGFSDLFLVYPNPSKGMFTLTSDEIVEVQQILLFDMQGRQLRNWTADKGSLWQLDAGDLPAGVYLLQINTEKEEYSLPLMLE